MVFAEDRS